MKAYELQLGDWVTHDGVPSQVTMVSAEGIVMILKRGQVVYTASQRLNPMLLTDEIIVANGWEFNYGYEDGDYYWNGDIADVLNFDIVYGNNKRDSTPLKWSKLRLLHTEIEIQYVHELQHLLHLCGHDNMAIGFSIKKI